MIKRKSKYWICAECAEAKGWKLPSRAVSAIYGLCGHCEREIEAMLFPVVDCFSKEKTDERAKAAGVDAIK